MRKDLWIALLATLCVHCGPLSAVGFSRPDAKAQPNLFVWTDTCNVYVLRDGDAALLINLGDGSVLDQLPEIGVKRVEWVWFTDHHREQCQGASKLGSWRERGTKVAAPEAERALFERPLDFRKMYVSLGDAFTIHGASFVRPPIQPIPLDRTFATNDTFVWRGREFACVDTRGSSPSGMTYLLREKGRLARVQRGRDARRREDAHLVRHRMGLRFRCRYPGVAQVRGPAGSRSNLAWLLPSHGPAVREPQAQLREYAGKLERLEKVYVRGYGVEAKSAAYQDKVSKPTVGLQRVAGITAPVQVQAPELLAKLLAHSFRQRPRAALGLWIARRADARHRARRDARALRSQGD